MKREVAKKKWMGDPPMGCDICGKMFGPSPGAGDYFVDGRTKVGMWGIMCLPCHKVHGVGFGTGRGQEYEHRSLVKIRG